MLIVNNDRGSGVILDPLGGSTDGRVRLMLVRGEKTGFPLILDERAADELARALRMLVDQARELRAAS